MFWHNFKYSLKTLIKDKSLVFWTLAFPIILGTMFSLAFSDIENSEKLDVIDIAIVDGEDTMQNSIFKSVFEYVENGEEKLFNTHYVSSDEAKEMIQSEEVIGYLTLEESPKMVVGTNGINETIFKYVFEEVLEYSSMAHEIVAKEVNKEDAVIENYEEFARRVYNDISFKMKESSNMENITSRNLSYTMVEFYTLIAMTALYGGILSVAAINKCLANMSSKGARVGVSPTRKSVLILSSLLASYVVEVIGLLILFLYTIFVLNVDYGNNLIQVIVTALVGTLAGLSLGLCVASSFKVSENSKTGILISFTMTCCFLSGMMGITMKYLIDTNAPIINKINPAAMITDALYSLYYYEGFERFTTDIISLFIFSFVMIIVSFISLRRQKYDSI